ncbi:MAG: septation protein SpoVG family protein [Candidatus Omnitrophica bacterium]|nr:septation protein SpoVG family protein [Candidatus Omnitrophota bacterium]
MSTQTMDVAVDRVFKYTGEGSLKAFVDLKVNEALILKGLRIVKGSKGLFVSMPRTQGKDGKWRDTITPLTEEFRRHIDEVVMAAYQKED